MPTWIAELPIIPSFAILALQALADLIRLPGRPALISPGSAEQELSHNAPGEPDDDPFLIFGALLALLMTGIPVAFTLGILGAGLLAIDGLPLSMVASTLFGGINEFVLLAIPLFLLMSNLLLRGGIGRDLFVAMQSWVGHWPGGLGIAALLSCGIFSAISGSSITTAATVGTVAIPAMVSAAIRAA